MPTLLATAYSKPSSLLQVNGVRAFIGGPCGPRGARFNRRGFYGRGYGPQGVVVVPVPGPGIWTDCSPPDPEQFEEYQKVSLAACCSKDFCAVAFHNFL